VISARDGEESLAQTRSHRQVNPTTKLLDSGKAGLAFQRKAIDDFRARQEDPSLPAHLESSLPTPSAPNTSQGSGQTAASSQASQVSCSGSKRSISVLDIDGDGTDGDCDDEDAQPRRRMYFTKYVRVLLNSCLAKKRATAATLGNPDVVDKDGLLVDVDVQSIHKDANLKTREDKRRDVDTFFHSVILRNVEGKSKRYRMCKLCP
jgi:hypothetical protein